jgi:spore germination cell wall hydrolase CwlJ-like protein
MSRTAANPSNSQIALALAGAAAVVLTASCVPDAVRTVGPASASARVTQAAPPAPEPLLLKPVAPAEAVALNAAIPLSTAPNPRAPSIVFRAADAIDQMRSLDCLAEAIYYEARSESEDGQRAVAQVVLNRVRHPSWPNSVCGVVYQGSQRSTGCQFTFTCDGSLARAPRGPGWDRARRLAAEALAGKVFAPVGHATHYHTDQVLPYWAPSLVKSAVIGAHIFYRWSGSWGQPAAFRDRYAGVEPNAAIVAARHAALLPPVPDTAPGLSAVETLPIKVADLIAAEAPASAPSVAMPVDALPGMSFTATGLPESRVREAYRNSGAIKPRPTMSASPE